MNGGRPAFTSIYDDDNGMTLRDYFAAHASEEDIQRHLFTGRFVDAVVERTNGRKESYKKPETQTREQARYDFADAMLAARMQKWSGVADAMLAARGQK